MKTFFMRITSLIIVIITLIIFLVFMFGSKKTFSENENRFLEISPKFSFSTLFKGEYIPKLENYLTDHFPLRDMFMSVKTIFDKMIGKEDEKGVYFSDKGYLIEKYNKPINNDKIIKTLNNFYDSINYVNLNLMLVPTSITINDNLLPTNAPSYSQIDTINDIYHDIEFNTIKLYDTLRENNKYYDMFYHLDHHWTTYGAYYSYVEYAKANEIDYLSINDFNIELVTDKFNGTLYSKSNDYFRKSDEIYLFRNINEDYNVNYVSRDKVTDTIYELDYLDKKDKYSLFLDNNHPLIVVTNNRLNNNKEIVVIKDSFGNSFISFLLNHFEKVHIIDPRFYTSSISDYIKDNENINDALIIYNMNSIDSDIGINSIR